MIAMTCEGHLGARGPAGGRRIELGLTVSYDFASVYQLGATAPTLEGIRPQWIELDPGN
jgi:hypothetical protein